MAYKYKSRGHEDWHACYVDRDIRWVAMIRAVEGKVLLKVEERHLELLRLWCWWLRTRDGGGEGRQAADAGKAWAR